MEFLKNSFTDTAFRWFTGVVEDINDPSEMGRVRVRCFGYHSADRNEIPTTSLPFAHVMMPITSASCSGIGESATGILAGSWVVGFFRDGEACQDPIILGTLPSKTPSPVNPSEIGFSDLTAQMPKNPGEVDNPRGSRSDYTKSKAFLKKEEMHRKSMVEVDNVLYENPTAIPPNVPQLTAKEDTDYFERKTWKLKDPFDTTHPIYPNNHVKEYKSGHTVEYDDTKGKERILHMHSKGTYEEIDQNSDRTLVVNGNDYQVVMEDQNVSIKGNCNVTIDGDCKTLVKGNYHLEVEKDYTVNVHGSIYKKVNGSELNETLGNIVSNVNGKVDTRIFENEFRTISDGKLVLDVKKDIDIDSGATVFMDAATNIESTAGTNIIDNAVLVDINGSTEVDIDGLVINLN